MTEMSDHDRLIRMDEKMDQVLRWQDDHVKRCHATHQDHEDRLRGLETWKWKETGALAVFVFAADWLREHWSKLMGGP